MSMQQYPEPTVGIFIIFNDQELLLVQSHKWPGHYVVPGGHVELRETLAEAAAREAQEETGLQVHDLEYICFHEFIYDSAFWQPRHFIFFDYACRTDSREIVLNDEAQTYVWVPISQALDLPLDRYTRLSIETYIARHASIAQG